MRLVISYVESNRRLEFGALKEHTESFLKVPSKETIKNAVRSFEKKNFLDVKAVSWKVIRGF